MDDLAIIDRFTETFSRYIDSGFGLLAGDVAFLTTVLVAIDITLAGIFWAMHGDENVPVQLIRKVLYVGFFALLLNNFKGLADIVFQSFAGLGLKASGTAMTAADLMRPGFVASAGFTASRPLLEKAGELIGITTFFSNFVDHRRAPAGVGDRAARLLRPGRPALHRHHRVQAHHLGRLRAGAVRAVRPDRVPGRARARQRHLLGHQADGARHRGRHRQLDLRHAGPSHRRHHPDAGGLDHPRRHRRVRPRHLRARHRRGADHRRAAARGRRSGGDHRGRRRHGRGRRHAHLRCCAPRRPRLGRSHQGRRVAHRHRRRRLPGRRAPRRRPRHRDRSRLARRRLRLRHPSATPIAKARRRAIATPGRPPAPIPDRPAQAPAEAVPPDRRPRGRSASPAGSA